uniref:Uncharacterized protein n=1 Tax=Tanacetum cinerariifolium TaxID=118510 RepID=A0A6L2MM49_TANCI|nr:hypothetical protein [Tanacetum cinerariifolium]
MVFHKMDTEEVSDRFMVPCFVNGLEAYDGEINIGMKENMILNEFALKLCLEHEVKRGNKVVKKELIIALRGEIYFVKFIINLEKDVEPVKEEEEAIKKVKGKALKEKADPEAFINPIKLEGREEINKVDKGITKISQTQTEAMRMLTNVHCQTKRAYDMKPDHQDPNDLDNTKPQKRYCFHKFIMNFCYGKDAVERQSIDLDVTTLRELIDSDGSLIPDDPQSGVPRVGIPKPPRASM